MTKKQKQIVLVAGVGGLALWWFYRSRQGLPILPSGVAGIVGTGGSPAVIPTSRTQPGSGPSPDDPQIVAARGAATGPLSHKACARPNRFIKTVDGPYYGYCVSQAEFDAWNASPGAQIWSTRNADVTAFLQSYRNR
jgi:hypothetical protein